MKKSIFSCLLFLTTFFAFGQEKSEITYRIISNPNNLDLTDYKNALDASNFECFRFETRNRQLTFKTGVVVELFSHNNVVNAGVMQENNCFQPDSAFEVVYELELEGKYISIQAPYDKSVKRVSYEK